MTKNLFLVVVFFLVGCVPTSMPEAPCAAHDAGTEVGDAEQEDATVEAPDSGECAPGYHRSGPFCVTDCVPPACS